MMIVFFILFFFFHRHIGKGIHTYIYFQQLYRMQAYKSEERDQVYKMSWQKQYASVYFYVYSISTL